MTLIGHVLRDRASWHACCKTFCVAPGDARQVREGNHGSKEHER
jgi:hypothetical protein